MRCFVAASLACLAGAAGAEEIQVVKSGKYYGTVDAYRVEDYFYLGAAEAARIYGGQRYSYAAHGRVQLSFRGKQVSFTKESNLARVEGGTVELPRPMIVRAGKELIPIEFFSLRLFADIAGVDSQFDPKTRLLLVDRRSSVGPLRWFSYPDHTRVVLELREDLRFQTDRRGQFGFAVSIPNGSIDWSEKIEVADGVLETIHLYQEAQEAHLALVLQEGSDGLKLREFKEPRRIVIDVGRSGAAAAAASARRVQLEAPPPPSRPPSRPPAQTAAMPRQVASVESPEVASVDLPEPAVQPAAAAKPPEPAAKHSQPGKKRYRIMIDAGHGGKDGGTVGRRGSLEKDINLDAARELAGLLEEEGLFDVRLTRSDDRLVKLDERSRAANEYQADLFISLHSNAHPSSAESGYEVYFLSERASDPEAERLAEFENSVLALEGEEAVEGGAASVLYALAKTEFMNDAAELSGLFTQALARRVDLPNRGVKQAAFYVLRGSHAPAVLVEMGFLSNAQDEAKLQSRKYRRKIVEGLYAGIVEYSRRKGWGGGGGR